MHFLGCFGFFFFSSFASLLIVLFLEEGWVRGLVIISTWPLAWAFSKTTNAQFWYKIKTYRDKTDIYTPSYTGKEQAALLDKMSLEKISNYNE